MQINGHTRLAAVIANPIKHSISPFIHNMAFERTGVNGVYVAWEITPDDIKESLTNIRRYNMFGLNVSMPYKQSVIPYLDMISPVAKLIGAVNTIVLDKGQLVGHNTDGQGFIRSLEEVAGFTIEDKKMIMLGSGGAATAIMMQAAFSKVSEIVVFTKEGYLETTSEFLEHLSKQTGVQTELHAISNLSLLKDKLTEVDLLVNGTSIGMDGKSSPIPSEWELPKKLMVADVIYQPFETPFLALARRQGLIAINGLGMLLYQAAEAFTLWTGQEMPTDAIWEALENKFNMEK